MNKILVINGPNLDMLGVREPSVYGHDTLADLEREVKEYGKSRGVSVTCFQANGEGKLIRKIHAARDVYDGIVYNPGAHTHYSYALRDAVGGIDVPCVEVHISDVDNREPFRRISVIAPVCVAQIKGRGFKGYCDAIDVLLEGTHERLGERYAEAASAPALAPADLSLAPSLASRTPSLAPAAPALSLAPAESPSDPVVSTPAQGGEAQDDEGQTGAPQDSPTPLPSLSLPRLTQLRAACADADIRTFFVRDTSNITWLTAFDNVFDDESAHALLVTPHDAVLHTDSRYSEAARAAAASEGVIAVDDTRITHAAFVANAFAARHAQQPAVEADEVVLGIEDSMTLAGYRALEDAFADAPARPRLRETSDFILDLRAVKDSNEIARMKAAQAITDAAFAHIIEYMCPGMTERAVQIELEDFMLRYGAEGLAFSSIVATGANGASPHAIPGQTVLEAGQCVVLDFGARAHGYCSDMTRTVFLGDPSPRLRAAYEAIRSANKQVEAALRPGVTGKAMHELAEQVLAEHGFAGKMGHGLGHGVGIDIHEQPVLSPRNENPLVTGNVVTVEPGVYLAGEFGMRLEDCGVLTSDGFEVFTQSTHDMVVL